jgi:hypothetical protein
LVKEEEVEVKSVFSDLVTIRARVIPKGKERKPFLIQRHSISLNYERAFLQSRHQHIRITSVQIRSDVQAEFVDLLSSRSPLVDKEEEVQRYITGTWCLF